MKKIMMLFAIALLFISFGCNLNNKNEKDNKDFVEKNLYCRNKTKRIILIIVI